MLHCLLIIMTPIGHASVSYITGTSCKKISLPLIILGGMLPDIDFLFVFFFWFNQVHRIISHNVFFIAAASVLFSVFAKKNRKLTVGMSLFLGGFLHLFIDACMDNNPTNGIGIALMWPVSDEFFSPFNLLHPSPNTAGWNEPIRMIKTLVPGMLYEIPFYIISLFLFFKRKQKLTPVVTAGSEHTLTGSVGGE